MEKIQILFMRYFCWITSSILHNFGKISFVVQAHAFPVGFFSIKVIHG